MDGSTQVTNDYSGLSKSQKKRMKRNASKKKKMSEIPDDSLNPSDRVRTALVKQGFELSFINEGLDEMWNEQLDYSDYDAALSYLRGKERWGTSQPNLEVPTTVDEPAETSTESKENRVPQKLDSRSTASTDSSTQIPIPLNDGVKKIASQRLPSEDAALDAHPTTIPKAPPRHKKKKKNYKKQPEAPLNAKLEMVANHENLNDAIAALTEWVVKSATESEVRFILFILLFPIRKMMSQRELLSIVERNLLWI